MRAKASAHGRLLPMLGLGLLAVVGACEQTRSAVSPSVDVSLSSPAPSTAIDVRLCHVSADGLLVPMQVEPARWPAHEAHGDVRVGSLVPDRPWFVYGENCVAREPLRFSVGFDDLTEHDATFTDETMNGVTVASYAGDWKVSTAYGKPAPFIYFLRPADAETMEADVRVTAGGALFRFLHVDVYSSTTRIPYVFLGKVGDRVVFLDEGEKPNTFGNFAIAGTYHDDELIDTLLIRLVNPSTGPCCANPVGLDNIRVWR